MKCWFVQWRETWFGLETAKDYSRDHSGIFKGDMASLVLALRELSFQTWHFLHKEEISEADHEQMIGSFFDINNHLEMREKVKQKKEKAEREKEIIENNNQKRGQALKRYP